MKRSQLLLSGILLLFTATPGFARIWRVDNNSGNPADFRTLQAAHDGAASGDTLYFTGSPNGYGSLNCSKKLYMFGPGYFLGENPNTQASTLTATLSTTNFYSGSAGSVISGFRFVNAVITVSDSNITIKRNISALMEICIHPNMSRVVIKQNYYTDQRISVQGNCANILIANNYLQKSEIVVASDIGSSIILSHNVIRGGGLEINNATCNHNILIAGTLSGSGNYGSYNIGSSTQFQSFNGTGNQANVDSSSVFVLTGSTDGRWQLKSGSPAIGAGDGGEDIGMFGGDDPYVLSGLPAIPAIYYLKASGAGSTTSGLPVRLKAKSHN